MEKSKIAFYQVIEKENLTGNERVVATSKSKKGARKFMKLYLVKLDDHQKAYHIYVKSIKYS